MSCGISAERCCGTSALRSALLLSAPISDKNLHYAWDSDDFILIYSNAACNFPARVCQCKRRNGVCQKSCPLFCHGRVERHTVMRGAPSDCEGNILANALHSQCFLERCRVNGSEASPIKSCFCLWVCLRICWLHSLARTRNIGKQIWTRLSMEGSRARREIAGGAPRDALGRVPGNFPA